MSVAENRSDQPSLPPSLQRDWVNELQAQAAQALYKLAEQLPGQGELPLDWARRIQVPPELITKTTAATLGLDYVEQLNHLRPAASFIQHFPISYARQHRVLVFVDDFDQLTLALADLSNWKTRDTISRVLNNRVKPFFAPEAVIQQAINRAYEQQSSQPDLILDTLSQDETREKLSNLDRDDLLNTNGQAPVVELINMILLDAVKGGASDIHLQPYREKLVVRYRIDGVLFDSYTIPKEVQEEALSRVKVMGKMNIAEKRLPQDGRATVTVGDRVIDLRIASLPGNYGERIVLRLLDKSSRIFSLSELGMEPGTCHKFSELLTQEHGLILLTGPTGSGKTTTLYAGLQEINTSDRNVVTLEDPIEYDIEGISQTQINTKKGLTFAAGLRNVLRQDPDIIMVGEIRDQETAVMAIQSALTGHLVFSTLHTNDAASAITRLLDLGIEPYLVSSSLLAVLAQRLVRKVCSNCAVKTPFEPDDLRRLQISAHDLGTETYSRGKGCAECRHTGYRGRLAVNELLTVTDELRGKIQDQANASEIRDVAIGQGMLLLRQDGIQKIKAGITTPEEVARVTVRSSL